MVVLLMVVLLMVSLLMVVLLMVVLLMVLLMVLSMSSRLCKMYLWQLMLLMVQWMSSLRMMSRL